MLLLLWKSWDCNIYRALDGRLLIEYSPDCLGAKLGSKKNPAKHIQSIQWTGLVQRIEICGETGFLCDELDFSLGSPLKVHSRWKNFLPQLKEFTDNLEEVLKAGIRHLDIHPRNIFYSNKDQKFFLIDWNSYSLCPEHIDSYLQDDWALWRLRRLMKEGNVFWLSDFGTEPIKLMTNRLGLFLLTSCTKERFWDLVAWLRTFDEKSFDHPETVISWFVSNAPDFAMDKCNIVAALARRIIADHPYLATFGDWALADVLKRSICCLVRGNRQQMNKVLADHIWTTECILPDMSVDCENLLGVDVSYYVEKYNP